MSWAVLALFVLAAPAADPRADNVHYRAAETAFAEGRWEDAIAALERAYDLDPRPEFLFMMAQVLREHDRCDDAIARYREFIATAPPREDVLSAQAGLQLCGAREPEPTSLPPPVVDVPPPQPLAPPPPRRKPGADPLLHALVWPGLAIAVAGVGMLVGAHARIARAERAPTEPEFERIARGSPALSQAGIALTSIGSALVVGGLVRLAVVRRRAQREVAKLGVRR
ncbi:MAG TPA: tetratricopeptide repeat protein [Nannocystaceae bacterium]|nr:tetratricopeptide repeat protein [Nannocystaceae bacterium]